MINKKAIINKCIKSIYTEINCNKTRNGSLIGIISRNKKIFPFGYDSKIIGRLFEIISQPFLKNVAKKLGYKLGISKKQTDYPDFWFKLPSNKLIAIDIKTTYKKFYKNNKQIRPFHFTLGSYTSFLRNGTKNIYGNYSDYMGHIVIGFLYKRNRINPTTTITNLNKINKIKPPYEDVDFFVQEKYKIGGQSRASGDTNNIGTIKSSNINDFKNGKSYFSVLGNNVFEDYWQHYPKGPNNKRPYTNLKGYIKWLNKRNKAKAIRIKMLYKKWKCQNNGIE